MRKLISAWVWVLLLTLGACAHPPVRTKGFEPSNSTRSQLQQSDQPRSWAVVIGVNSYIDPTWPSLKHAADDAREIGRALRDPSQGAFDRVTTLTDPSLTTRESILFELRRLRSDLRRQDTLVLYFSGHGTMEFAADGSPRLYLVTSDSRAADLQQTAIEVSALREFLGGLKAQRKVMILDSCFAGEGKSTVSASTRQRLSSGEAPWEGLAESFGQSEAVLMASTFGGTAQEDDRLGHGTYTWHLLKALGAERPLADVNGDGAITAYEAHDYARWHTLDHTSGKQIPEGYFRLVGRADMFLSGRPDPERARASALVYAYSRTAAPTRLSVDGRTKGAFPATMAIEAGTRDLTLTDADGKVIASGRLELAPGQVLSLDVLTEELKGYRRYFGLGLGGGTQLSGPADVLWGQTQPRLSVQSGYRVRGGALRGLSLSFELGWSPSQPTSEGSIAPPRDVVDGTANLMLRRGRGPYQFGAGVTGSVVYVPPSPGDTARAAPSPTQEPWLVLPGGPLLWQGYALSPNVVLTAREELTFFLGDLYQAGEVESNVQLKFVTGLEVGF